MLACTRYPQLLVAAQKDLSAREGQHPGPACPARMQLMRGVAARLGSDAGSGGGCGLFGGAPARLVHAAASWRHRNPFDMDELGSKSLSDGKALMSIDEVEHQRQRTQRGHEEAKEAAIKLLAARPHSQKELRAKLLEKGFGMELIHEALARLQELGLQSDREFAEVFARSKWRTSKWGAAKLEAELARRGVGREHVSAALQQVFGEEGLQVGTHIEDLSAPSPSPSQLNGSAAGAGPSSSASATASASLSWGSDSSAEDAAGALLAVARRQFEQSRGLPMEARRRRLVGWLQRRGHRWGDISVILKQLEKEAAAQALDAAASEEELP